MTVRAVTRSTHYLSQVNVRGTSALVNVGNFAPLRDGATLEPGRLVNIHHQWGNELGSSAMEAMSIVSSYAGSAASSTLKEAVDAVVVTASANDTGNIQVFNGAIKKTGASTNVTGYSFAAWPTFWNEAGTITTSGGLRIYGVRDVSDPAGGTFTNFNGVMVDACALAFGGDWYGINIGAKSGGSSITVGIGVTMPSGGAANHCMYFRRTGTTAPTYIMDGGTSGTITVTTPAAPTSWTLTLPPDDGDAGEQLQTNGSGVSTWEAAASTRDVKNIHSAISGEEALQRIRSAPVYRFHYDKNAKHVGGDYKTEFVGIVADEAPWAMMHNGRIFNPINAFGHAAAAIQALAAKVEALEAKAA